MGTWFYELWWDQEGLVLAKAWVAAVTAGEMDGIEVGVTGVGASQVRRIKYQPSINMRQSLVSLLPIILVGTQPPNYEDNMGPRRPVCYIERDK